MAIGIVLLVLQLVLGGLVAPAALQWSVAQAASAPDGAVALAPGLAPEGVVGEHERAEFISERPLAKRPGTQQADDGLPGAAAQSSFLLRPQPAPARAASPAYRGAPLAAYAARAPPTSA